MSANRRPRLHCFSETLMNVGWVADYAASFSPRREQMAYKMRSSKVHKATIKPTYRTTEVKLKHLLSMDSKGSYPFSFASRGLPPVMSEPLRAVADNYLGKIQGHSYLSVIELENKATELLIVPDPGALEVRTELLKLIESIPVNIADRSRQRIIYWFDLGR